MAGPKIPLSSLSDDLGKLAAGLSDNIESRAVPLAKEAYKTVEAAGIFNKTVNKVTPDVKEDSIADLSVGLDELLAGFKEPKSVEGTGRMAHTPNAEYPRLVDSYTPGTGVLMSKGAYSANRHNPSNVMYPVDNIGRSAADDIKVENMNINEGIRMSELANPDEPRLFANKRNEDYRPFYTHVENIPGIGLAGAAGVGVAALAGTSAQAKERPLEEQLQLDMGGSSAADSTIAPPAGNIPNKGGISLLSPQRASESKLEKQRLEDARFTAQHRNNIVSDEIAKIGKFVVEGAVSGVEAVQNTYGQYQMQKDSLDIKSAKLLMQWEAETGKTANLTEMDKEVFRSVVGALEGDGLSIPVNAAKIVPQLVGTIAKRVNANVLQPLWKTVQGMYKAGSEPQRQFLRDNAPSIAILAETAMAPLIGLDGWGVGEYNPITDPDADPFTKLDPEVRKLIDDKNYFIGTEAGAGLLGAVTQFKDLPIMLIGGSTKLGMALSGMASEANKENPEFLEGGFGGIVFGEGLGALASSKPVQGAVNLLGKAKDQIVFKFGEALSDVSVRKFTQQRVFEPLLFMSDSTATRMADEAAGKAQVIASKFEGPGTKPMALMLDVGKDGIPKVFGAKDGRYTELGESGDLGHIGDNGKSVPVILSTRARKQWVELEPLRNRFYELISKDVRPTRANGIDEWTSDLVPPDNDALVVAWKNKDEGGMLGVYRAGSNEFNAELLKSKVLSVVHYNGPDGQLTSGLGYFSPSGVVFAPDPSEGIPGAITRDLIMRRRFTKDAELSPLPDSSRAWEVRPIDDDKALMAISKNIKQGNLARIEGEDEIARGGMFADNVPLQRQPAPFDNLPEQPGNPTVNMRAPQTAEVDFNFLPFKFQDLAKALQKGTTAVNNGFGKLGAFSDTAYGEKFKVDASIQAFSLRHFKRYVEDLDKQLTRDFDVYRGTTPQAKLQFNDDLKAYIEGGRNAPPSQLIPAIQQKMNKFVDERNADYDMIKLLGGTVPAKAVDGEAPKLEKLFALDYLTEGEWIARAKKTGTVNKKLLDLMQQPKGAKPGKGARDNGYYDEAFGRVGVEREISVDYMNRKRQITQLNYMKELADNPQASSTALTPSLGHDKLVDFEGAGMLKGKFVSRETFNAIHTYPADQKVIQNNMLGIVNAIKFNKTVLNPMTWGKNIMGNVWGVMNSNIVPTWSMAYHMPKGIRQMSKDLAAYNGDMLSKAPAVERVHETLKYGLLGAEFENSKTKMMDMLDNLADKRNVHKTWGENIAETMLGLRDATVGNLGNAYSKVDMATKYSLYVNGLERWGISMDTNQLEVNGGRTAAGELLGHSFIGIKSNFEVADLIKREVVRRIHLSLPMVDRIGTVATGLSKASPITNPWLRTASELMRVTLQMPYRMANEKGYFLNALGTAGCVGAVLGLNKAIRMEQGISDKQVDDALAIAPDNIKRYMPGATATMFRASDGGIVFIDLADTLIEPLQWFKGGEDKTMPQRFGANMMDMVFGGGLLQDQNVQAQAALGLVDEPQSYNKPFWKQDDTARAITDIGARLGPQIMNNAWQLYSTANLPPREVMGEEELRQPMDMQLLRAIGLDVASLGTEKQKQFKLNLLDAKQRDMRRQKKSGYKQTEGSSTGTWQSGFNINSAEKKLDAEEDRLDKESINLMKRKSTGTGKVLKR